MNKAKIKNFINKNSALIALIFLFILATILQGTIFLNIGNIINIILNNSIIGIISLGMALIIITGGIDLSVGSQMAFIGLVGLSIMNSSQSIILGVVVCLALGILLGGITGIMISHFKIPAFIVTLGTMTIYRSISQYFYNGAGVIVSGNVSKPFITFSNYKLFDFLPLPIIVWLLLSIIIAVFSNKTATGRHIFAVGSNEKAAKLSGIRVNRIKTIVFIISGALVAIAALVEGSRLGSINSASSGSSYEMDAIAAVVIGGTSMTGGKGRIINTVFGTLTIGIINNMMTLMGIPPFLVGCVKGSIIIISVLLQTKLNSKEIN